MVCQLLIHVLALAALCAAAAPIVNTTLGPVEGFVDGHYGTTVFKGIPYAKPPVGKYRFMPTEKHEPWTDVKKATKFGAGCPQICHLERPLMACPQVQSENCLFLNVYVPPGGERPDGLYPVGIFIHGGNYIQGAGGVPLYDGSALAKEQLAIVVSINYRLGVLGGLSIQNVKGNFQLTDQRMAMMWVHHNIERFGGDPTRVTLLGQSAGGFSVASHLTAPKSWPYFQRAIVQSNPYALPATDKEVATQIGSSVVEKLGCPANVTEDMRACLENANTDDILKAQQTSSVPTLPWEILMKFMPWTPVIDEDELPMQPLLAAQTGQFNHVPILMTNVANESIMFVFEATSGSPLPEIEYDAFVLGIFGPTAGKHILEIYGKPPESERKDLRYFLSILATDYIFFCANFETALGYHKYVDTYFYLYDYLPSYNNWVLNATYPECDGYICHGMELPALFDSWYQCTHIPEYQPCAKETAEDGKVSKGLRDVWGKFVHSGSLKGSDLDDVPHIPVVDPTSRSYLNMSYPEFEIDTNLRRHPYCAYFDTIGYSRK